MRSFFPDVQMQCTRCVVAWLLPLLLAVGAVYVTLLCCLSSNRFVAVGVSHD
jgi:hypothetical protein